MEPTRICQGYSLLIVGCENNNICEVFLYLQKVLWLLFSVQFSCGGGDQTCKKHSKMSEYKKLRFCLYVNRTCHLVFLFSQPWHVHNMTELLILYNKLEKHSKSADFCQVGTWRERERERSDSSFVKIFPNCMSLDCGRKSENPKRTHTRRTWNLRKEKPLVPSDLNLEPVRYIITQGILNFTKIESDLQWLVGKFEERVRLSDPVQWIHDPFCCEMCSVRVSALQNIRKGQRWNESEAHARAVRCCSTHPYIQCCNTDCYKSSLHCWLSVWSFCRKRGSRLRERYNGPASGGKAEKYNTKSRALAVWNGWLWSWWRLLSCWCGRGGTIWK